jgi:1-deoxy-D-xylulose-5-phosphate synthase
MTELTPQPRRLLEGLSGPEDLKRLQPDQLPQLCEEVRSFLLESVQRTGGHLGSNLGVVELTAALHYVFDFRLDKIVFDVSHQAYVHKLFTGRREGFEQLRRTGGMCGFTHPEESEYDLFHLGHAGTAISLGLGVATGLARENERRHVVSVVGDASLGAGVAFEGLNTSGASGERLLVVLNDNEWSISKSVGSLARYLTKIRSNRLVQRAQEEVHGLLSAIPKIGPKVERTVDQLREVLRHSIVQGHVFEELGVTYVGPVDGHDVGYLVESLERVSELEGVVLLHVLTEKGRGHPKAPTHPERVHAAKPGSGGKPRKATERPEHKVEARVTVPAEPPPPSFTKAVADGLIRAAERDVRVHAITAGMPSGTGLLEFAERYPTRFHDVGITEQNAVAMAAGMAKAGLRPVATIYSTFLQRGYDQVFQEVALQGLPVLFCMDRAGLVGQDGPTHNGVFDIAMLRTFPNMTLCAPRDATDCVRMIDMALAQDGPVGMRYPRANCPARESVHAEERREMLPGRAEVLATGEELVLWGFGEMVGVCLQVAERLRGEGIEVGVVDARFAKPLDEELLAEHARTHRHIVTIEDHQRMGGFGSAVLEAYSRVPFARARVKVMGIPDRYVDHMTTREEQLAAVGLDAAGLERSVRNLLSTTTV